MEEKVKSRKEKQNRSLIPKGKGGKQAKGWCAQEASGKAGGHREKERQTESGERADRGNPGMTALSTCTKHIKSKKALVKVTEN